MALEQRAFARDRLSRRQWRHHIGNPQAALLVCVEAGALLGDALMLFRRGSGVARLYSLAVAPVARGRGIGGALLRAGERMARVRGAERVRLEVRKDNPVAIALYERHGYRRFGERPGYYADGMDAWRYEKRLLRRLARV